MSSHERRILIQAHALRFQATTKAAVHGRLEPRTQFAYVKWLLLSVALAGVVLAGILVAGLIVDVLDRSRR